LLTLSELEGIHERMLEQVRAADGEITAVYACPHTAGAGCACRKPAIGLLERAAFELGLTLTDSVLVGDSESDVIAARAAGCQPVLVSQGCALEWRDNLLVVPDLLAAVARLEIGKKGAMPC
jgi:D-glycero-D-manno-heptose 1,7-bisphosphate phosphatase